MVLNKTCISVLVIFDTQSSDNNITKIMNWVNGFRRAYPGTSVSDTDVKLEFDWADETTFDNNTVKSSLGHGLEKFNVVVLLHEYTKTGAAGTENLPTAGQTALLSWVNTGGVFIGSSWLSYDDGSASTFDNLTNMNDLLLWDEWTDPDTSTSPQSAWPNVGNPLSTAKIDRQTGLTATEDRYIRFSESTSEYVDYYYFSTGTAIKTASTALMDLTYAPNGGNLSSVGTFLAYRTYGQGLVFGINDAARLFLGLDLTLSTVFKSNGMRTSPTRNLFRGIVTEINLSLKGEHCFAKICFLADTMVNTDQGKIKIQDINPSVNTIDNKKILHITQTLSDEKELVLIKKNALGENQPDRDLVTTKRHRIFYNKNLCEAFDLVGVSKGVKTIPYKGEFLYNILMENWELIEVQNIPVETLHPDNIIAKLYKKNLTDQQNIQLIRKLNKCREDGDHKTYNLIKNNILS